VKPLLPFLCLLSTCAWSDPAVWEVSGGGGGRLWLLGSVHYLREQDYPLPANVDALFDRADALVMEIDLDDLNPLAVQGAFMEAAILPTSSSLRSVLTPSVYARTQARAGELGLELALLERFEPWMVALTLMDLGMNSLGFNANQGLEQYLLHRSIEVGKEILGLEALADQIRIFDHLNHADQEALLVQTLEELSAPGAAMDELLDAWRDGRLDTLASELLADFDDFPALYDALVTHRNRSWVDTLEQLLSESRQFLVVVGALHLVGRDSVIDLLENRGLTVTPVRMP